MLRLGVQARRDFGRWADWGIIVMAGLAAVSLALTVIVARADLGRAAEIMVRGEGESIVERLHDAARAARHKPPSDEELGAQLAELAPRGLRYVELRRGPHRSSAGASTIPHENLVPGDVLVRGDRAVIVVQLPPPREEVEALERRAALPPGAPPPDGRPFDGPPPGGPPDGPPPGGPPPDGPPPGAPPPRGGPPAPLPGAWMIVELTPSVLPRVQASMDRTAFVGSIAVVVLCLLAGVLTRRAMRRTSEQRIAERERRLVALGQMSGLMAHELRNPLASLKGHAQLLAEMVREGSREHAKALVVVAEAERLEALTRDLLAFVRDGEITRARVAPRSLIRRAIGGEADPRVAIDLTGAPENLWVDEARLAAALGNLVRNALQASEDAAAPVAIRITEGGGAVVIEVRDHGPGVLPGDEERIFEPFFTTRVHGTGLGLAVARRAVEQHDGTLRVEAAEGGGARFVATLPGAGDPP